jgi:hypothetical protein
MDSTTFPITCDRPSRIPMTMLGAGPEVWGVKVSPSTVNIRLGWAFQATIPREAVASVRPLTGGLSELHGPLGLGVLRVQMRRLIVSAEDQSGLVAALTPSTPRSPGLGHLSL